MVSKMDDKIKCTKKKVIGRPPIVLSKKFNYVV